MTEKQAGGVAILGVLVADVAFRASRQPNMGETLIGSQFKLGPGGKGSNQAIAAARLGIDVTFISKLGRNAFTDLALETWRAEGVKTFITQIDDCLPTDTRILNPGWFVEIGAVVSDVPQPIRGRLENKASDAALNSIAPTHWRFQTNA